MAYPDGYKYTKDHEWIDVAGDRGKVGITDYAQAQLGDVVYIELPDVGTKLKAGQSFGTIESVKAVSELYSPVAGEVVDVNTGLKDKPEVINSDPHGSWMVTLKLANEGEVAGLLDHTTYEALIIKDWKKSAPSFP
jgi:glycine cleavage system H protein